MLREIDTIFRRWAAWQLAPVPGQSLGYGTCILARVMEGRGTILPGAPKGSGPVKIHTDPVANQVERFLRESCGQSDARLIRVYYLRIDLNVPDRALKLRLSTRTLYRRLNMIHRKFVDTWHEK